MKNLSILVAVATSAVALTTAQAQFSMDPLTTFGGGDGWFAPGEGGYTYLGTGNTERGMAFGNGVLYLVSRSGGNNIRRLDSLTGSDLGSPLDTTGITGGTFAVNKVGVSSDGNIFVGNLTVNSGSDPFKVYQWATEGSVPTVAYSGATLSGARVGDSTLAVTGSGTSTRLATGFGNSPSVAGNNGYSIIDPTAGTSTEVGFVGTPPAAGDFRLGLTFTDSTHIYGNQGSQALRYTSFAGSSGTLDGTATGIFSIAERPMSYSVINGLGVLATISTGDSTVRIYDASNPLALVQIGSGNNTSGTLSSNGNGTGDVAWGDVFSNGDGTSSAYLYSLSSNQGIQAYLVTIPEPSVIGLAVMGFGLLGLRLARRNGRA